MDLADSVTMNYRLGGFFGPNAYKSIQISLA